MTDGLIPFPDDPKFYETIEDGKRVVRVRESPQRRAVREAMENPKPQVETLAQVVRPLLIEYQKDHEGDRPGQIAVASDTWERVLTEESNWQPGMQKPDPNGAKFLGMDLVEDSTLSPGTFKLVSKHDALAQATQQAVLNTFGLTAQRAGIPPQNIIPGPAPAVVVDEETLADVALQEFNPTQRATYDAVLDTLRTRCVDIDRFDVVKVVAVLVDCGLLQSDPMDVPDDPTPVPVARRRARVIKILKPVAKPAPDDPADDDHSCTCHINPPCWHCTDCEDCAKRQHAADGGWTEVGVVESFQLHDTEGNPIGKPSTAKVYAAPVRHQDLEYPYLEKGVYASQQPPHTRPGV